MVVILPEIDISCTTTRIILKHISLVHKLAYHYDSTGDVNLLHQLGNAISQSRYIIRYKNMNKEGQL
jgi:hypothetical protein